MLPDHIKDTIQSAYRRFLSARKLAPRTGQRNMIAEVARTLGGIKTNDEGEREGGAHIAVIEAGTGTGKTIGYLLPSIPLAREHDCTLVISTATVSLQEQLLNKDIPDLQAASGLEFSYGLAKGRGRYLCLQHLDRMMAPVDEGPNLALFENYMAVGTDRESARLYGDMHEAVNAGRWNGDRDEWTGPLTDEQWRRVAAEYHGCTGRHCAFYEDCFFYQARAKVADARVIVANHDLVLADLALGGGQVLPAPEKCIYVFDEAHHLPDKALNHLACSFGLRATQQWLKERARWLESALRGSAVGILAGWHDEFSVLAPSLSSSIDDLWLHLRPVAEGEGRMDAEQGRWQHRFGLSESLDELAPVWASLSALSVEFLRWNEGIGQFVADCLEGRRAELARGDAEAWSMMAASDRSRLENLAQVVSLFARSDEGGNPWARWIDVTDTASGGDMALSASPILAGPLLRDLLWNRCHGAIATSATLSALGSFSRFRERSGVPDDARFLEVDSPFDYPNVGTLWVADTEFTPEDALRHNMLVVDTLARQASQLGTLVLFTSRRQMDEVFSLLPDELAACVLVQGRDSKQALVDKHRARIDEGDRSVLFGLASFSEGVDLPGAYCETLIIARLPFAVPDAPVDAALSEYVESRGGKPFFDITVPDAAIRLKQMVGRLIRTERDHGDIYILDARLLRKSYGKRLLKSLPPFPVRPFRP